MVTTTINILDYVQLSSEDIELIKIAAKQDAINKLKAINIDYDEDELNFSFEIVCNTKITH